jgi:hypothetical protein
MIAYPIVLPFHVQLHFLKLKIIPSFLQDNITEAAIMLKDASGNPFQFTIINSSGLLYIEKKGPSDFLEIRIDSELVTSLSYNTSKPNTNECCDFGNLIDVEVTDKTFSVEDNTVTISL